jgi:hypothetical protein
MIYDSPFLHNVLATTVVILERCQGAALTTIVFLLLEELAMYLARSSSSLVL